jgi:hypothetical protein
LIAALIVITAAVLLGIPLVRLLDRAAPLGTAFIVGLAACTLLLLVPVPWSRTYVATAYAVVLGAAWACVRWRAGGRPASRRAEPAAARDVPRLAGGTPARLVLFAVGAIELAGYTLFATLAPLWEFDFLSDWGLKGRVYALAGGVDWAFLQQAWYRATHADYPPLLPLAFDLVAIVNGAWDDRWIGLLYPAFALAGAAIAYGAAREEVGERWAALIAVIVLPLCATPWLGLADGPFAVTVLAAIVMMRRGERASRPPADGRLARRCVTAARDVPRLAGGTPALLAVLAGCAALMKNEGYVLIVALAVTRRKPWQLWPAAVIALPWLILRRLHGVEGDLAQGSVLERIAGRAGDPLTLIQALITNTPHRWLLWAGILIGALLVAREERKALTVIAVQLMAYVAVYFATPHDIAWHIRWSWERLVTHVWPALVFVLLVGLAKRNAGPEEAGVPEVARGD